MSTTSTGSTHLDPLALAGSAAVVWAIGMVLLGAVGALGVYEGTVEVMEAWHLFFEPTALGTAAGAIEAAVIGFVPAWAVAWLYSAFVGSGAMDETSLAVATGVRHNVRPRALPPRRTGSRSRTRSVEWSERLATRWLEPVGRGPGADRTCP